MADGRFDPRQMAGSIKAGDFWRSISRAARQLPFVEDVVAAYYCSLDRDVPLRARAIIYGALAYFVLPTDTIPDFLLGIGFTDDAAVLAAALGAIRSHLTPAHRLAARDALAIDR